MDHLAHDLSIALEETESCGPLSFTFDNATSNAPIPGVCWGGIRRRARSAGNLFLCTSELETSSCSNSDLRNTNTASKSLQSRMTSSFHQSDSDERLNFIIQSKRINHHRFRLRQNHIQHLFRNRNRSSYRFRLALGNHGLESDSVTENSPGARPLCMRRKRKLKRIISIEEAPVPPTGKRKRPHKHELIDCKWSDRAINRHLRIKPLHPSVVEKIEKFFQVNKGNNLMDTQYSSHVPFEDEFSGGDESSISWSGGEGNEGDDELTDWAPPPPTPLPMDHDDTMMDTSSAYGTIPTDGGDSERREVRTGCRRLAGEERCLMSSATGMTPTGSNERVKRFLQDSNSLELRLTDTKSELERSKLGQLAQLYSLELWRCDESLTSPIMLRKTERTPFLHSAQRPPSIRSNVFHKRIRTSSEQ